MTHSETLLCKELLDLQELNRPLSKRVQIQGHRGGFKPENTMSSFKQAVEHGLDAIELDVKFSLTYYTSKYLSVIYRFG